MAQRGLDEVLSRAGVVHRVLLTSRFATTWPELARRYVRNRPARLARAGLEAGAIVMGVDGEGWRLAGGRDGSGGARYAAVCKAVLGDVLAYEPRRALDTLRIQASWEGQSARRARLVVVASSYAAGRLAEVYAVPPSRIRIIPEPFDVDRWQRQLPRRGRDDLVLAVGHAYSRKNYRALIAAWKLVARRRPSARLVVVGHGPEMPALRALAAGTPSIELAGHVPYERLLSLYASASVFCHPSLQENFGIAVVEAAASGLSLVVHRQEAVLESVGGLPGVWDVDARDAGSLAEALLAALDAPSPWPPDRLEDLRGRLDPLRVGRRFADVLAEVGGQ
ncbi:MAG: glycosyltransferase family 4 protein [Chloroflexota bacterium]